MNKKVISFAGFFVILFGIVIYFVQQVIAFTPSTEDEVREWRTFNNYQELGLLAQDIEFETFTNSRTRSGKPLKIRGWLFRSASPDAPTVIALHGKGSNRIGVLRFGKMFQDLGFNILIYDQRHHGRSEGSYTTYGYYEAYDVKAAIDFLESQNINTERLGIIGESFGAATSLLAGAIEPRIKFVIADSSYTDMPNAVKDNAWRMNYMPHYPIPDIGFAVAAIVADFNPWEVRPIDALKTINKPVLIVHCDQDEWAYPKYAHQLYEASDKKQTDFKMFSDCEHVAAYDDYTEEYEKIVKAFLKMHLAEFLH